MLGLVELLAWVIGIASAAFGIWEFLPAKVQQQLINWVGNWTRAALAAAAPLLTKVEGDLLPIVNAFAGAFENYGGPILTTIRTPLAAFVKEEFTVAADGLVGNGESTPDNAAAIAANAMADAMGFGVASAGVTAAFEAAFPEKLNTFNGIGPMLAQMAGFEEVAKAVREPLYENAFGKSLDYHYRSIFKPELPDEADAVLWHGRGLLTDAQLAAIFNYSGLKPEYENAFITSGYRAVQPRAIATAIQDTPFPTDEMRSLLKFNGYRDQDVELMLTAFEGASTRNVRNQYLSALTTAAERGTITDADLDASLTTLDFSDVAKNFVHLTVATRKLEQLAEIYRKSVSEAYKYGLVTDADYVTNLEAIGIAAADAQAHYAVDSIAKQGKALLAEERAAAAAAKRLEAAAVKAAVEEFRTGTIDGAGLSVALLAAGMDPGIAGFAVAYNELRLQGAQVNVAGKLVSKADAVLLRAQIAAIGNQVIYAKLDENGAQAELIALGIPGNNRQALIAGWIAHGAKLVIPIK
jgi:hypothetical protein